jgi:hypothetical protein
MQHYESRKAPSICVVVHGDANLDFARRTRTNARYDDVNRTRIKGTNLTALIL